MSTGRPSIESKSIPEANQHAEWLVDRVRDGNPASRAGRSQLLALQECTRYRVGGQIERGRRPPGQLVDFDKLKAKAEKLGAFCVQNPRMGLMTAAESVMSK